MERKPPDTTAGCAKPTTRGYSIPLIRQPAAHPMDVLLSLKPPSKFVNLLGRVGVVYTDLIGIG